jgi:uncharacterized surface protein with fasciclin (FAS1) repeats
MSFSINKFLKPTFLLAGAVSLLVSCNKELPEAKPIETAPPTGSTITELLNDPSFSILKAAVAKAAPAASSGLQPLSALFSDNTAVFTFFAPTDAAFQIAFPGITSAAIAAPQFRPGLLDTLLRYHLVGGQKVTSAMIPTTFPNIQLPTSLVLAPPSATLPPGLRMSIFPSKRGNTLWANNIPITQADIAASNGVIHKVAVVVAPPSTFLWNRIEDDPELTYLEAAIKRADEGVAEASTLQAALKNPAANLTIFAPTDAAFRMILTAQITQALMAQGMDQNTAQQRATQLASTPDVFTNPAVTPVLTQALVKGIVVYHILGTRAFSVNIPATPMAGVPTLVNSAVPNHPGVTIQATFGATGVTAATVKGVANGTASNILIDPRPNGTSDQHYINGVIHKIDQVLRPQ